MVRLLRDLEAIRDSPLGLLGEGGDDAAPDNATRAMLKSLLEAERSLKEATRSKHWRRRQQHQ